MKTIEKLAAQGDVIFRRVKDLPKEATETRTKGRIVVAHSETGHHHVAQPARGGAVALMTMLNDPMVSYLRVDSGMHVDIIHERPFETHETLRLLCNPGDIWEVRRQREWTPEGWRRVED